MSDVASEGDELVSDMSSFCSYCYQRHVSNMTVMVDVKKRKDIGNTSIALKRLRDRNPKRGRLNNVVRYRCLNCGEVRMEWGKEKRREQKTEPRKKKKKVKTKKLSTIVEVKETPSKRNPFGTLGDFLI